MLEIRDALISDIETVMEIYRYAQDYMIASGNSTQWGHFYPSRELIRSDIDRGVCKLICDGGDVHGVFAMFAEPDPAYAYIEDGEWLNDDPYLTMHRVAGDGRVHGLFSCAVEYCKKGAKNIRIDTHRDNATMQRLIEKNGFRRCGIIYTSDDHTARIAYQWSARM